MGNDSQVPVVLGQGTPWHLCVALEQGSEVGKLRPCYVASFCQAETARALNVRFLYLFKDLSQIFSLSPQNCPASIVEEQSLKVLPAVPPEFLLQIGAGFQPSFSTLHFSSSFYLIWLLQPPETNWLILFPFTVPWVPCSIFPASVRS